MNTSESKTLKDSEVQREVDSLCLGTKILKLRQRRSMTLQEVSILSGLSKSLLSQIENDASAPPLTTLIRFAVDSNMPHLVKNVDRTPASAIAVIYTPDG